MALPGVIAAAVMKNAAAEKSPAISTARLLQQRDGRAARGARPTRFGRRDSGAAAPLVARPAIARQLDRLSGEEPGEKQRGFHLRGGRSRMKWRVSIAGAPASSSGRRPSVVSIRAPKARSCAATGSIGRRRSESSPSKRARTPAPAHAPRSIRAVEPEFMQSTGVRGASAAAADDRVVAVVANLACRARSSASRVARTSRPGLRCEMRNGCGEWAPAISARCEMDLSPGTPTDAAQRARTKGHPSRA